MEAYYKINEEYPKTYLLYKKNENLSKTNPSKNITQEIKINNNDILTRKNIETEKNIRLCTVFEWDGKGRYVYLTGSFCNWHQFFEMEKSEEEDNKYFLILFLPKGIYQYKFKIDDKWKYNTNFPICSDNNGNINNIIDLTKDMKEDSQMTDFSTSFITKGEDNIDDKSNFISFLNKLNGECKDFCPEKKEVKDAFKDCHLLYNKFFNIDYFSNQNKIGCNLFLKCKERNILNENYSYKNILPLKQEQIEHFNVNMNSFNKNKNNKFVSLISACTFRYRYKFITYIYYKPNKPL